jgi:hypothetical protein
MFCGGSRKTLTTLTPSAREFSGQALSSHFQERDQMIHRSKLYRLGPPVATLGHVARLISFPGARYASSQARTGREMPGFGGGQ